MHETESEQSPRPLLQCLMWFGNLYEHNCSANVIVSGLPVEAGDLTPDLFSRASGRIGLVSNFIHRSLNKIDNSILPVVALLEDDSACILTELDRGKGVAGVVYPDISDQVVEVTLADLENAYTGMAIFVRAKFTSETHRESNGRKRYSHWFWSVIWDHKKLYRDVLTSALFINGFALVLPFFAMNIYDRVVPNKAIETLWVLTSGVAIVLIADLILKTLRAYFLDLAGKRVDVSISTTLMETVLGLRLESRPVSVGSFTSNMRSFEMIRDFLASASITTLVDLPFTLLFLLVIGWISPWFVIPLMTGMLLILAYARISQRNLEALSEETFETSAIRNSVLVESLSGLDTVKAMAAESRFQKKWEDSINHLARIGIDLNRLSSANRNVAILIQQAVFVCAIVIGVYLISLGGVTLGGLIAVSMLTNRAMAPFGQIASLISQFHHVRTSYRSIDEIMMKPQEKEYQKQMISRPEILGRIEFKKVGFKYPGSEVWALKNVSFVIEQGDHVAVLGRIGSGKSTVQNLIMGLFLPTEGTILIDGVDIHQLDLSELRAQMGYVPQEIVLFHGTLRENILLGYPSGTDDEILTVAKMVNLHSFANHHPNGFDMFIGERGDSLSGGQRQTVGLARALVHNPQILLLDEPTSSMDHSTEFIVRENLSQFSGNKTMLIVTHRPAMLDFVTRVLVMDEGVLVADGSRDKVLDALKKGRIGRRDDDSKASG